MKKGKGIMVGAALMSAAVLFGAGTAQAENGLIDAFGGWAEIGRPGNDAQSPANRNHTTATSDGLGSVDYVYWTGKHQVTIDDWSAFYNDAESGRLGTFNTAYNHWNDGARTVGGGAPVVNISFHQAAQYANWLSTGNALSGAYQINASGQVTNIMSRTEILATGETYYVLPTLNEWFKAAYFHQDTQTYSRYSHGLQTIPPHPSETEDPAWSYRRTDLDPQYAGLWPNYLWEAGGSGEEINGTFDMMGNAWEWIEDLSGRQMGGSYSSTAGSLDSARGGEPYATQLNDTEHENPEYGFRVVALQAVEEDPPDPEPELFGGWAEIRRVRNAPQGPANRNHTTATSDGLGSVDYVYWTGKHQVTIDDWSAFYNDAGSGRLGTFNAAYNHWNDGTRTVGGGAPVVNISFHQAAQYANWLTTGSALSGAYQIDASGQVTNIMSRTEILATGETYYVLPTLNEWFKAAYFHQDTQTYSRYAHGLQTIPPHPSETEGPSWAYRRTDLDPQYAGLWPNYLWAVGSGGEEINGTFDMMGNTFDWIEDLDGRQLGGGWSKTSGHLESARGGDPYATHNLKDTDWENTEYGLRIVSIPPEEDPFNEWLAQYGYGDSDPDETFVEKGGRPVTLRQAYLLGEDPDNPEDVLHGQIDFSAEEGLQVEFQALAHRLYSVERKDNLFPGEWEELETGIFFDQNETYQLPLSPEEAAGFYRIRAAFPSE